MPGKAIKQDLKLKNIQLIIIAFLFPLNFVIHFLIRDTLITHFLLITAVVNIRPLGVIVPISGHSPPLDCSGSRIVQNWLSDWTALVPVQESERHRELCPLMNPFGVFLTSPRCPQLADLVLIWGGISRADLDWKSMLEWLSGKCFSLNFPNLNVESAPSLAN